MPGEYLVIKPHPAPPHYCKTPGGDSPLARTAESGFGSVWVCECGQAWRLVECWSPSYLKWERISERKARRAAAKYERRKGIV